MKDAIDRVIGVIDENATVVACSDLSKVGSGDEVFAAAIGDTHEVYVRDGYTYKAFGIHVRPD